MIAPGRKRRVLLVDDDERVARAVGRWLALHDFEVTIVLSPLLVGERLLESSFDIVISDYSMPWMSGVQVLRQARALAGRAVRCLVSGALPELTAEVLASIEPVLLFEKPMQLDVFVRALEGALLEDAPPV